MVLTQRAEPGMLAVVDLPTRTITGSVSPRASGSAPLLVDAGLKVDLRNLVPVGSR